MTADNPSYVKLDHEWEAPPDLWLDHTSWGPGQCAHFAEGALHPCGIHQLEHHDRR